jgi:hypothetical protein
MHRVVAIRGSNPPRGMTIRQHSLLNYQLTQFVPIANNRPTLCHPEAALFAVEGSMYSALSS